MPNTKDPTTTTPKRGVACPFPWCTQPHVDDWINDDEGDAWRAHIVDLPAPARPIFGRFAPYLVVHEKRTVRGVLFSPAGVMHDEDEGPIPVEQFAARLTTLLEQIPAWQDAARTATELRSSGALA